LTSRTPAGRSRTAQFVYNGITNAVGLQAFKDYAENTDTLLLETILVHGQATVGEATKRTSPFNSLDPTKF
jgi:hypothetical protein